MVNITRTFYERFPKAMKLTNKKATTKYTTGCMYRYFKFRGTEFMNVAGTGHVRIEPLTMGLMLTL